MAAARLALPHALCLLTAVLTAWGEFGFEQVQVGRLPEMTPAVRAALETVERSDHPAALGAAVFTAILTEIAGAGPGVTLRRLDVPPRFAEHPDPWVRAAVHLLLGGVAFGRARLADAEREFAAAVAAFREAGDRWGLTVSRSCGALIARCTTALGAEGYRRAWDLGHTLAEPEKLALPGPG